MECSKCGGKNCFNWESEERRGETLQKQQLYNRRFEKTRARYLFSQDGGRQKADMTSRPNVLLRSSRIKVDQLSYESKPTDKREQYDWRAEKSLDGIFAMVEI